MSLEIPHSQLARLYAYWAERGPAAGGAPRRADIDPLDLPGELWPQLFLYERTPENRLRCRLCGTAVVEAQGRDITGLHIDEVMKPEALPLRHPMMLRVLDECRPLYYEGWLAIREREHRWTYRLMLPLAAGDDPPCRPSQLFGGVFYGPPRQGGEWHPRPSKVVWGGSPT